MIDKIRKYVDENQELFIKQLIDYVNLPSVARNKEDAIKCSEYLVHMMEDAGIKTQVFKTPGNPIVYGEIPSENSNAPTVLFYGHYDVQPVEPLNEWTSPPFKAEIREGRIYGRGAGDNKGQHLPHVIAAKAYQEVVGKIPINVKFIVEGEEESGSPNLTPFVEEHRDLLQADIVYISDGPIHESDLPLINFGNRGVMNFSIEVTTAATDHHSGNRGGVIPNAGWELVRLLQSMSDGRGNVTIDGFYDNIISASEFEEELISKIPFNQDELAKTYGVEKIELTKREFYENICFQPVLSINSLGSGDPTVPKNIIPAKAIAKCDVRMVANQDPDDVFNKIVEHINKQGAKGNIKVYKEGDDMLPSKSDPQLPISRKIIQAVEDAFGKAPIVQPVMGGSLPNSVWTDVLKLPTISVPYANADENNHAPNENMRVDCYLQGIVTTANVLMSLGKKSLSNGL